MFPSDEPLDTFQLRCLPRLKRLDLGRLTVELLDPCLRRV